MKIIILNCDPYITNNQYSVKKIQADWGGEFRNNELAEELQQRGTSFKETVSHHSEKTNAIAERANRTIFTMSRTALIGAGMLKGLWDRSSLWATYTKNWVPHKALKGKTAIEILL